MKSVVYALCTFTLVQSATFPSIARQSDTFARKYGKFNGKFKNREPQRTNKLRRMIQRRQQKCILTLLIIWF